MRTTKESAGYNLRTPSRFASSFRRRPASPMNGNPSSAKATRVRYSVLGFACTLAMITYLDRACIRQRPRSINLELGLQSIGDLTYALIAFSIAYAIFEVPTGWLG